MRRLLPLALLLAGCVTASRDIPSTETERVVTSIGMPAGGTVLVESQREGNITRTLLDAPPEVVWSALQQVQVDMRIPVNVVDTRTRITGMQEERLQRVLGRRPSWWLDCGAGLTGNHADQYEVTATLLNQVFPAGEGRAEVRTRFEASAKDRAHSNNAVRCTTTGRLERQIAEALRAAVAGRPS